MLGLAKQKGTGMCGDNASYGSSSANTPHRLAQATGNDGTLNAGAADMVLVNQNPLSTGNAWAGNSIELNGNGTAAIDILQADLRDVSGDQESCFGFSETGNPQKGGSSSNFYAIAFPTLTVTYSTSITMSFDINDNAGTLLQKGNILLRSTAGTNAHGTGATATYTVLCK